MDIDSTTLLTALLAGSANRETALARLHEMMLRIATHLAYRRGPAFRVSGPELDDLAHQAANDAMVSLLGKLDTFRGESRFTTWAYRFVALEVSNKLSRHFWRTPSASLDVEEYERLPAVITEDPLEQTQHRELSAAVRRALTETLTDHQRRLFVAIVIDGVPINTMAAQSGSNRGAIYKTVFDARRKIRAYLASNGYLADEPVAARATD
ncbi:RNA polymerase sigma-70 factor (ECF subfamily) [Pseudarthrobacter sp. W1I19]|uniref:sigma-70 family RNA polymerase sigma factor n=1 Tax=Pseudarthrobacter sp. W1I19 TaxID=3042288 RepID=UPI0027847C80|nr:sigma-70 family RNA polymerase sigma factor [Pseudarthrobacter sp. W1I19]MDQ0923828.1 RNA polymerase sigma-70 factor (ECF subfamily) [Pseudarthrobacter sp. W1I19]